MHVLQQSARCVAPTGATRSTARSGTSCALPSPTSRTLRAQLASASRHEHVSAARRSSVCQATPRPGVFLFGFGGGQQYVEEEYDDDDEAYTVMKIQVGIFGDIAKWQKELERLAHLYDTSREGGLHAIMQDTLQHLMRNTEFVGYVTTAGKMFDDLTAAESKFNEVSFDERSKFKEETLVSVDGRTATKTFTPGAGMKDLDQWMCVTLLVAVERELKLPKAQSVWEVKQLIKTLAGVTVDELVAFELLWTPQDNGDSYSKEELLADYPSMVTIN